MAIYIFQAIDQKGQAQRNEIHAQDKETAMQLLLKQGLTVISLKEKGVVKKTSLVHRGLFRRISSLDRILLVRHLASIVRAGVPLGEALDILIENNEKRPLLQQILEQAKRNLQEGHPFSSVFQAYPEYFPPVFVGLIKAGESSGTLEETLENLSSQLFRDYELNRKVVSAMIYPALLLVASIGIIVILFTFVLPRLEAVFGEANIHLPITTVLLITISKAFAEHKIISLGGFLVLLGVSTWALRSMSGKRLISALMRYLPIFRGLAHQLALARFSRTLHNLIKSGISIFEALEIVASSVGNSAYEKEILVIREELRKGIPLSDSFKKHERYFPRLVTSLLAVGERTGTLDQTLATIASFYEEEVERALRTLVALLEPALLLIMGLIVGGVALSVLLPIYQLVGQVK